MNKPLFYGNVVPLNSETHRKMRLKQLDKPLDFARKANLVPALVDEFEHAMEDLPIAFLPNSDQPAAVFVSGLMPGTNSFLTEDGLWKGKYVPAYLRRYPFIIGDVDGGDSVLCIDDSYEGLSEEEGVRLFLESGEPEEAVGNALAMAQNYRDAAARTDEFAKILQKFKILRAISLDSEDADGKKTSVHGLMVLDEEAFASLSDKKLGVLHKAGFLKAIYCHLFSLRAVSNLNNLLVDGDKPDEDVVADIPKVNPKAKKSAPKTKKSG